MLLHLVRASRGAAHTICAVNGDEGSGSHNIWLPVGIDYKMKEGYLSYIWWSFRNPQHWNILSEMVLPPY